jgi:hypothetical protein
MAGSCMSQRQRPPVALLYPRCRLDFAAVQVKVSPSLPHKIPTVAAVATVATVAEPTQGDARGSMVATPRPLGRTVVFRVQDGDLGHGTRLEKRDTTRGHSTACRQSLDGADRDAHSLRAPFPWHGFRLPPCASPGTADTTSLFASAVPTLARGKRERRKCSKKSWHCARGLHEKSLKSLPGRDGDELTEKLPQSADGETTV